jgi:pimeloyl-ACP methyl ester carboxylesterase
VPYVFRVASALLAGLLAAVPVGAGAQREDDPHSQPVKAVGDRTFVVDAPEGRGVLRYFGTGSLDGDASAERVLIDIHGLLRNADTYERTGEAVLAAADDRAASTFLITPQFLTQIDVTAHALPAATLRWEPQNWLDGFPAIGPAPLSAFSVLDALLLRLADRTRFPALREIVLAGHSAGGQLVQRYAIVGRAPDTLAQHALRVRFVVANPSSYLYFDAQRPSGTGFAPFPAAACPAFNRWKYGGDEPPPYVEGPVTALEAGFVARDVTYLLGLRDVDPNHPVLDKSCSGETEGRYRLARGEAYVRYLRLRHPAGTAQSSAEVPGVAHDALRMFTSACGLAVLFGTPRATCVAAAPI